METEIDVSFAVDENGGLRISPSLTNTGETELSFTTGSSKLFDVWVEDVEGNVVWQEQTMYAQVVLDRRIEPGGALSSTSLWEHPNDYQEIVESYDDRTLDEYCDRFGITDWQDYEEDSLTLVVETVGLDIPTYREDVVLADRISS